MIFYFYFSIAVLIILFFTSIIIYFGRAYITGAPYAVSTQSKTKLIISILQDEIKTRKDKQKIKAVDLGSGDGRIVIALARAGFEAHGYETNPYLVCLSRLRIWIAGLSGKAFIHQRNYWQEDLEKYDVLVCFGVFYMMEKLERKLSEELRPGSLVVSNYFKLPQWKEKLEKNKIFLYVRS